MTLPLDIHASSVSPAAQAVVAAAPSRAAKSGRSAAPTPVKKPSPKKIRHASRNMAGLILGDRWRVQGCGRKLVMSRATIHQNAGTSHFSGVETCGSVWVCPVCAAKITEGRREEIDAVLRAHREAGGTAYMATLTLPHHAFQACAPLRSAVATAWRKVKSGKAWVEARERFGWVGDIRALEITHGKNGWHPHLHVLVLFEPWADKDDAYGLAGWIFERWRGAIERMGLGHCNANAFSYEPVNLGRGAADYVAKWGASLELTKAHTKASKHGRTPFQILADYIGTRSGRDARLFREYATAFRGARHLTWSRDLRRRYGLAEEQNDEDLSKVDRQKETHRATIDRNVFKAIVAKHLTADVLVAFETAGVDAVADLLTRHSIPFSLSLALGFNGGTVPLITDASHREPRGLPPWASPCMAPRPGCRRNAGFSPQRTDLER